MSEVIFAVPQNFRKNAWIDETKYIRMYKQSIEDSDNFWREQAKIINWLRPFTVTENASFDPVAIKWFEDGTLNVCANCVDRHLPERGDKTAIIWQGDADDQVSLISYRQLHEEVCRFANVIKEMGVKRGDRVCLYMPMIPQAAYAMLACARIGAVHSVVFAGFSADSLADRINDAECSLVITADEGIRGGKIIPLKKTVDQALLKTSDDIRVLVVRRTGGDINWHDNKDFWYHDLARTVTTDCPVEEMGAEDPLFILYTSGSTGKPKGVLHTSGGYLVYAALTHKYIFDYHDQDIYWCTADVGWITGHSYVIYGPLANGATTLMFEGVPNHPDASRIWQVVDKHKVSILYTAPTAIRALMGAGDDLVTKCDRATLRLLGTVGEPINPEAWEWFYQVVGEQRCPIVDTWWQTETGGIMITPFPGATALKPGSATRPFFGIIPQLMDKSGQVIDQAGEGSLCIAKSWPGQMRTVYGDHDRFVKTYFSQYPGKYFTGDGCYRDQDNYYWISGRIDDVLNVSGHRMGTAEIESAFVAHPGVAEAAVVGFPHPIKGQGIYCYVTLMANVEANDRLAAELKNWVREQIGVIATPDYIQFAPSLPKTRSGKIMRRILRKIAAGDEHNLGDISTLADSDVVEHLLRHSQQNTQ